MAARSSVPVCDNTSAMPSSTITEPTALCTTYLTAASSEVGCSWWKTTSRNDAMAIASNHTHRLNRSAAQPRPTITPIIASSDA